MTISKVVVNGVTISGKAWFKLASLGEKRGLTVAQVLSAGVEAMVADPASRSEASRYGRATTPVERRKMTARRLQRCRELYALGLPDREIANRVGLDVYAIEAWRGREDIPARPRIVSDYPYNPKERNRMSAPALTPAELAAVQSFGLDKPEAPDETAA